ncbi:hypothetical protein FPZ24_01600 [Sphingomonas panacisoli]|uniref:Uncharacterized protein n=1 Tax=Sphingomonas panacisoli TaxID=1813879 RepID=A0A5B8LF22_9SPHN|nr:hypothetical protein [Sphingomonas panacisoli]QDZ06324.1 hypothetical protein FPZ24_01600 [Sphingomonas panacisoli]
MKTLLQAVGALFLLLAPVARAQTSAPTAPPNVIELTYIESDDAGAQVRFATALRAQASDDPSQRWIAGRFMTGASRQLAIVSLHSNYAHLLGWETMLGKISRGVPGVKVRNSVLSFNPRVSYNPGRTSWGKARSFGFSFMYLRRGATDNFVREQTLAADLLRNAKVVDEEFIGYGVMFGDNVPAYLFLTPMAGLGDLDIDLSHVHNTLFTEEQDRNRGNVLRESVVSGTNNLFIVAPEFSNVTDAMRSEDPAFWARTSPTP